MCIFLEYGVSVRTFTVWKRQKDQGKVPEESSSFLGRAVLSIPIIFFLQRSLTNDFLIGVLMNRWANITLLRFLKQ